MYSTRIAILFCTLTASGLAIAGDADIAPAVAHSGRASGHASGSAAHAIAASGKTTSAIVAVPLSVAGAATSASGVASMAVAGGLAASAGKPAGPLPITAETITTTPPDKALQMPAVAR